MSRPIRAGLGAVAGYVMGALAGLVLVALLSSNSHDKSVEQVMTAAFVTGPVGAIMGLFAGLLRSRTRGRSGSQ